MIKTKKKCIKNYGIALAMFIALSVFNVTFGQQNKLMSLSSTLKASLQTMYNYQDKYAEDKVLQEVYIVRDALYKKIVELAVLYYCKQMIVDADILYEKMLIDMSKDVLRIVKLLAQYLPLLYKNKKIPKCSINYFL